MQSVDPRRFIYGINAQNEICFVEEALEQLRLFDLEEMPQLTHGACPSCEESVLRKIDAATRRKGE